MCHPLMRDAVENFLEFVSDRLNVFFWIEDIADDDVAVFKVFFADFSVISADFTSDSWSTANIASPAFVDFC